MIEKMDRIEAVAVGMDGKVFVSTGLRHVVDQDDAVEGEGE